MQVVPTDHKLSLNLSTPQCSTFFHSDQNTITYYNIFLNYYAPSDQYVLHLCVKHTGQSFFIRAWSICPTCTTAYRLIAQPLSPPWF